jgi:hypothetical protein
MRDRPVLARLVVAGLVLLAGCTGGGGDERAGSSTTSGPVSTTTTTQPVVLPEPDITTATTEPPALGRSADSIFGSGIAGGFELVELDLEADRAVREQFSADERLDDVFVDVETRVVRQSGVDVAAVAALALSPSAALSEEWRADFEAGVFADALSGPSEVRLGTETLQAFSTGVGSGEERNHSLLWRLDNVFVVVTAASADLALEAATGLVEVLVGPIPTTTTTAPPTTLEG